MPKKGIWNLNLKINGNNDFKQIIALSSIIVANYNTLSDLGKDWTLSERTGLQGQLVNDPADLFNTLFGVTVKRYRKMVLASGVRISAESFVWMLLRKLKGMDPRFPVFFYLYADKSSSLLGCLLPT